MAQLFEYGKLLLDEEDQYDTAALIVWSRGRENVVQWSEVELWFSVGVVDGVIAKLTSEEAC